jgi:hypothetical protein
MTLTSLSCLRIPWLALFALPWETWVDWVCVCPPCAVALCQVMPNESAIDLAHSRCSARLQAASQRPATNHCLHFRAAAYAALLPDPPWPKRVCSVSQLLPEPLLPAPPRSRSFCCHVRSQSVARERTLAPYPPSENASASGYQRGPGPPTHPKPFRCSLSIRSPPLQLLWYPAATVYPFLCVLSGKLPFCHSVPWDSLPLHGICPRFHCQVFIIRPPLVTAEGYTLVDSRWRCVQHFLFSCQAPHLVARILYICGLISWTSCPAPL